MVEFLFFVCLFVCSCAGLSTPFIEEAIFTPFYVPAPFVKYLLTIKTWVDFWAPYSVPLIYVSVLMPVPECVDYSGLVV